MSTLNEPASKLRRTPVTSSNTLPPAKKATEIIVDPANTIMEDMNAKASVIKGLVPGKKFDDDKNDDENALMEPPTTLDRFMDGLSKMPDPSLLFLAEWVLVLLLNLWTPLLKNIVSAILVPTMLGLTSVLAFAWKASGRVRSEKDKQLSEREKALKAKQKELEAELEALNKQQPKPKQGKEQ